jgi:hypothetical protein
MGGKGGRRRVLSEMLRGFKRQGRSVWTGGSGGVRVAGREWQGELTSGGNNKNGLGTL